MLSVVIATHDSERALLFDRATTAAYVAYQRTSSAAEEAESLLVMARTFSDRSLWRPALDATRQSLELREVAEVRQRQVRRPPLHEGLRLCLEINGIQSRRRCSTTSITWVRPG